MRRIVLMLGALLALAILVTPQAVRAQSTTASVRLLHAAPDAPPVDIYIDDVRVAENTPYFTFSPRLSVEGGEHRVRVVPAGFEPTQALLDQNLDLDTNQGYLIAVAGSAAVLELRLLDDNVDESPDRVARVRMIHLASGGPAVDVKQADGDYLLTNQGYLSDDYLDLAPGSYTFDILAAGSGTTLVRTPKLRFEGGWNYDVVVTNAATPGAAPEVHLNVDRTDADE